MTQPKLHIRPYRNTDKAALIQLWMDCELTRPWNNPVQDIERKLRFQPEGLMVGELKGRLVASVMCGYDGHRGWANYLAVSPDCRSMGFGRLMMRAAEEYLYTLGAPKVNLQIRNENHDVIEFYKAIGYLDDHVVGFGKRLVEDEPYSTE